MRHVVVCAGLGILLAGAAQAVGRSQLCPKPEGSGTHSRPRPPVAPSLVLYHNFSWEELLVRVVSIRGGGIAACCCSHLLRRAGFGVADDKLDRPKLPAVMLSETSQKLLQDLFQQNKLFAGVHRIRRRAVLWGEQAEAVMLPHYALVVSEATLLNRIQAEAIPSGGAEQDVAEWEILAARTHPSAASRPFLEHAFGTRMASALPVMLKTDAASDACWIESQPEGWLFLLPSDERSGWLLAVGVQPERILAGSRLIGPQITATGSEAGSFASYPRIAEPLCAPGWLACGSAALGFDPLCGDGAGHAVREAILGSAVICAASQGGDVKSLVAHYEARLVAGFRRHLEVCRQFYEAGRCGPWWDQQIADLNRGLEWCSQRLARSPGFRYRLNGFALEPVR